MTLKKMRRGKPIIVLKYNAMFHMNYSMYIHQREQGTRSLSANSPSVV